MKAYRILSLCVPLALGVCPMAAAQSRAKSAELNLDQAVSRVQQETQGQVLSAESRRWDRRTEYRIKVLTPQGHVRVVTVPASTSGSGNGSDGTRPTFPSPRNPPARRAGGKEKH